MGEATADREPIDGISERKRARGTGAQTGRGSRQRADWSELHDGAAGTVGAQIGDDQGAGGVSGDRPDRAAVGELGARWRE